MQIPDDISRTRPDPLECWIEVTKGPNKGRVGLVMSSPYGGYSKTRGVCWVEGDKLASRIVLDRMRYLTDGEVDALIGMNPAGVARARDVGGYRETDLIWGRMPQADETHLRCYVQPSHVEPGAWCLYENATNAVVKTYPTQRDMSEDIYANLVFDHAWAKRT